MIQDLHHRTHGAGFWIVRAIYEALDARMHHRAGAHGARFNCNKQFAVSQAMITDVRARFAQRNDFRMRGGIGIGDIAIPSAADDFSATNDNGAYRDFANLQRSLGAAEGFFHP